MRKVEEETQQTASFQEAEAQQITVQARPLRAAQSTHSAEQLASRTGEQQLTTEQALSRARERRPFIRALEEAINGGDSYYQPWADLFETLTICLSSGMTVPDALRMASRKAPPELQTLCEQAAVQVAAGMPLHQALVCAKLDLPELVVPILEHGANHGTLEATTRQVMRELKRFVQLDRRFAYSAINPDLVIVLLVGGSMLFGPMILEQLLFGPNSPEHPLLWAGYIAASTAVSGFTWKYRHRIARRQARNSASARFRMGSTRTGMLNRHLGTARWARTFVALYNCGVPISSALEAAAGAARNPHYADALRQAACRTRDGWTLYDGLARTRLLPKGLLETIRTGETAGDLGPILDKFVDTMEDDARMLAAQTLGMKIVGALFGVGGICVALFGSALGLQPKYALFIGLACFVLGLIINWMLFLTAARNDL